MPAPADPARPWLARFVEPVTIRRLGTIEYVACRAREGGERRVLVAACAGGMTDETSALLAEIARIHRLLDHPRIPRVVEADASYVALACDAVVDLETITLLAAETRYEVDVAGAAAFTLELLKLVAEAHRVVDPMSGGPVCMGAFATTNVLLSPSGELWVLGWGHPWAGAVRARLFAEVPEGHVAPETVFGVAPKPGSDVNAITAFFHSFRRLGAFPPQIEKAFLDAASSSGGEAAELMVALILNAQALRAEDRMLPQYISDFEKAIALFGIVPELARFTRDIVRLLERMPRASETESIVVARDGSWCRSLVGPVLRLERRGALRRMILALAAARRDAPGAPLSWEELLAASWPEENPRVEAAKNRVYVAIASLRSMGLRDVLLSHDAGYFFDPNVSLTWTDAGPP